MAPTKKSSNGRSPLANLQRQITAFFGKKPNSSSPSPSPSPSPSLSKLNPNPSPSLITPSPLQSKTKNPVLVITPNLVMGASDKSSKKSVDYSPSEGSNHAGKAKSSSNSRESLYREEKSSLLERADQLVPKTTNWLLLTEQEEGYHYTPQLGDEVVYLRQGHEDYLALTQTQPSNPWLRNGDKVRAVEVCSVEGLEYVEQPGSGESCCQIALRFIDTSCSVVGHRFQLTLSELNNFPDFIVERSKYNMVMERNWSTGDNCQVWWRDESAAGGAWWEGEIIAIKDRCDKYPGSPWERYLVKYKDYTNDAHGHCPWELHDPDWPWEQPTIDFESKDKILHSFAKLARSASKDEDRHGIIKLNEVALKLEFMNRFIVPLSLDIIKSRIENDYYRSLEAMKHDFEVVLVNAKSYFPKNTDVLRKVNRLSNWFDKILVNL